jgi:hypothetical protein
MKNVCPFYKKCSHNKKLSTYIHCELTCLNHECWFDNNRKEIIDDL